MKNFKSIYSNEENESHELNFKAEKSCTEKRCEVISINVKLTTTIQRENAELKHIAYRIKPVISSFAHFIRIIRFVFRYFFVFMFHLSSATTSRHQFIFVAFFRAFAKICQTIFDRCCILHSKRRLNDLNVVCFSFFFCCFDDFFIIRLLDSSASIISLLLNPIKAFMSIY